MLQINVDTKYKGHITRRWSHLDANGEFQRDVIEEDFDWLGSRILKELGILCYDRRLDTMEISTTRATFHLYDTDTNEAKDIWVEIEVQ